MSNKKRDGIKKGLIVSLIGAVVLMSVLVMVTPKEVGMAEIEREIKKGRKAIERANISEDEKNFLSKQLEK